MQTEPHFSWLREIGIPAFFTLLGAALGFFASQVQDERKAIRAKDSFKRAIGMELDALGDQLDASLHEVRATKDRVQARGVGPRFAAALRTSVFSSQIGKLRDVDDSLLLETIHFYSDLGTLEQIFLGVNEHAAEYNRASVPSGEKDALRPQLISGLMELELQISGFGNRLRKIRAKLPPAQST
jgi:hypothetical protein